MGWAVEEFKAGWAHLRRSPAGRRFQEYHARREEARGATSRWGWLSIGWLLTVAGAILLMIPGPGIPIVALGLAAFARESLYVARFLDAAELRIRRVVSGSRRLWIRAPAWAKVLATVTAVVILGALSVGAYEVAVGD